MRVCNSEQVHIFISVPDEEWGVTIEDSFVVANTEADYGGGMYVTGGSELLVYRTEISGHYSVSTGSGAAVVAVTAIFSECAFLENSAGDYGGGAAIIEAGVAAFSNSGFAANDADVGGAIFNEEGSEAYLVNTSTSDNIAYSQAGAVYNDGYLDALHSTFWLDQCAGSPCDTAGIHAKGENSTTILDRSILLAETSSGTYLHCDGTISTDDAMSEETACFTPDIVGDSDGMSMCGSCDVPVVAVASPSAALSAAVPCGLSTDARGVSRSAIACDVGAYEAP